MSKKVLYAPVGGRYYPLVYSLGAMKQIGRLSKNLKALEAFSKLELEKISEEEKISLSSTMIDLVSQLAEILIAQGCAYKNCCESNFVARKNSAVDEYGHWQKIKAEEIEAVIENDELPILIKKVLECIKSGKGSITTQPNPKYAAKKKRYR